MASPRRKASRPHGVYFPDSGFRIGVHPRSSAVALILFAGAVGAASPVSGWQCAPTGASVIAPAAAEAARDYLDRVEALYPHQVVGLVRAGERYYLLNSRDVEWGDRTRLYLLALRLHDAGGSSILRPTVDHNIAPAERRQRGEPYLAPQRQAPGVTPGGAPPAGSFICLASSRAEREGVGRTQRGEIVLAAGQSVQLVDPQEPRVAVEVRAARDRPLNLGDIFQRSARAGIYAGLTGGPAGQPAGSATIERPDGTLIFRTASVGASVAELRGQTTKGNTQPDPPVEILSGLSPKPEPAVTAVTAPAPAPVAVDAGPAAVPPVAETTARAEIRVPAGAAVAPAPPDAGQAYDDYAKAMKTLMALKRSGGVRSISEMTYVHPAVEVLRRQRP